MSRTVPRWLRNHVPHVTCFPSTHSRQASHFHDQAKNTSGVMYLHAHGFVPMFTTITQEFVFQSPSNQNLGRVCTVRKQASKQENFAHDAAHQETFNRTCCWCCNKVQPVTMKQRPLFLPRFLMNQHHNPPLLCSTRHGSFCTAAPDKTCVLKIRLMSRSTCKSNSCNYE